MAAKPFESKIQNLVYNVDVGIGLRVIKVGVYLLCVFTLMVMYTAAQFWGLKDAEAMDYAQLGRNLSQHGKFVTQCVRPASMWYLIENSKNHNPIINQHPDILHAPLWPTVLAGTFKVTRTKFPLERKGRVYGPETWIIGVCHLFTLLTGWMLYLLGKRLFDRRIAFLSVTVYFLSNAVWSNSISGLTVPLVTFLATTAMYLAVVATTNRDDQSSTIRWAIPLAGSLLLCILAFWTRYAAAVLAPVIALYLGFSFKGNGWKWAVGFLLLFLIGATPWLVRNKMVSGGLLGLAPYTALNNTRMFEDNEFERSLAPSLSASRIVPELQAKMIKSFQKYYEGNLRTVGDGLFICLFLAAFFYRFVRSPVHLLRWGIALGAILLMGIASIFGESTIRLLNMFWPVVILYGLAFFFILLERLQLRVRLFNLAITTLFVVLAALPLILTMMPPRSGVPYPPYFPPFIMHVSKMLTPEELMCTDMPWATAWYGNRNSLLLPGTIDEFYEINDYSKRISGLYFTTITRNKPYVSGLLTGSDRTWFPLLEGRIPGDFPLTQGFPLNNMDQMFLTDRIRWNR